MDFNDFLGSYADESQAAQSSQYAMHPPMNGMEGDLSSPIIARSPSVMYGTSMSQEVNDRSELPTTDAFAEQGHAAFVDPSQIAVSSQNVVQYHNGYDQGQPISASQDNVQYSNGYQVRLQDVNTAGDEHGKLEANAATALSQPLTTTGSIQPILRHMVNSFHTITQLVHNLNNRMTKAEYERDVALRRNLAAESNITFAVPQTAPVLGDHVRFRDGDDIRFGSPVTPTKRHTFAHESFTQEPEQSAVQTPTFGSKLTDKNKKKSEKTTARKSLQIKLPSGKSQVSSPIGGLPTPITKHAVSLPALQAVIET
jgi:hypothetical protein